MPKTVEKILDILSARIVEKYKPVVIGVFDDCGDGTVSLMIKKILEKKYAVYLSGPISGPEREIPYAMIGVEEDTGDGMAAAAMKGIGLALRKNGSYPNIIILRMETRKVGDMKRLLEIVRPDISVFAAGETCHSDDPAKKGKCSVGEKSLLLRSLRKDEVTIFCADDETIRAIAQKSRGKKIAFGYGEEAKVRGKIFRAEGSDEWTSFKISYRGTIVPFQFSSGVGEKKVCAALAAAAVGLHMGFNLVEISEALRI